MYKIRHIGSYSILLVTVLIAFLGMLAADIYLPSLPIITSDLSISVAQSKLTISSYMFALAISQLFYGLISDKYGRRRVILFGVIISIVGSLNCALASGIWSLLIGRFIQGIGVGAGVSLCRTILRDCFSGTKLAQMNSYASALMTLAPTIGPILGGYIQNWINWRASFIFIVLVMLLGLITAYYKLPETNKHLNPFALKFKVVWSNYKKLFSAKHFIANAFCSSFVFSGIIVYASISPFLLQERLGLTPIEYSWTTVFIAAASVAGKLLNSILVKFFELNFLIIFGISLMIISSSIMIIFNLLNIINLIAIICTVVAYIFAGGFIFANITVNIFDPYPKMAGLVGSVYSFIQIFGTTLISSLVAIIHLAPQILLASTFFGLSVLSFILYSLFAFRVHVNATDSN